MSKGILPLILFLSLGLNGPWALAFPTSSILIPSDQTQTARSWRFDSEVLFTLDKRLTDTALQAQAPEISEGLTYGLFNNGTAAAEAGVEWWEPEAQDNLKSPHLHFKFSVLETEGAPSVVMGVYDIGVKANTTDFDVIYAGIAKTFEKIGHFLVSGFVGNGNIIVDDAGNPANRGVSLSWQKSFPNLMKNFGLATEYQTSNGPLGFFSFGGNWSFKDTVLVLGYNIYNNRRLLRDTVAVEVTITL